MKTLNRLHVQGYKSIRDQNLEVGSLNVFIGGNGAGKSNLINIFHFFRCIVKQELQTYTGNAGGANALLYFGRKNTAQLDLEIEFVNSSLVNLYNFTLVPTNDDRFIFQNEATSYWNKLKYAKPYFDEFWTGHMEARISESKKGIAHYLNNYLASYRIYHFHDTSSSAPMKQTCNLSDNRELRADAGNLAAFLYWLQEKSTDHFQNIEDSIKQVAPFFNCFRLAPLKLNSELIRLEWEEKGSDGYFNAAVLSDGTLRFICLATLLLQPELPSLILIDEPELGLHPAAIHLLAGLLQSAASRTQLIVATQSVTLINQLLPEHVWIVDREDGQSIFRNLQSSDMSAWLEDYGLGELWEKNILGGRP